MTNNKLSATEYRLLAWAVREAAAWRDNMIDDASMRPLTLRRFEARIALCKAILHGLKPAPILRLKKDLHRAPD